MFFFMSGFHIIVIYRKVLSAAVRTYISRPDSSSPRRFGVCTAELHAIAVDAEQHYACLGCLP